MSERVVDASAGGAPSSDAAPLLVDLTYRGLSLERAVPLRHVRPTSGFLELATPMPVGTTIALTSGDAPGLVLSARVIEVHEQVASAERPTATPGMRVAPRLDEPTAIAWWARHVAEPEVAAPPRTPAPPVLPAAPVVARPRTTAPLPTVAPSPADGGDDGGNDGGTDGGNHGAIPQGELADDGMRTQVMAAAEEPAAETPAPAPIAEELRSTQVMPTLTMEELAAATAGDQHTRITLPMAVIAGEDAEGGVPRAASEGGADGADGEGEGDGDAASGDGADKSKAAKKAPKKRTRKR